VFRRLGLLVLVAFVAGAIARSDLTVTRGLPAIVGLGIPVLPPSEPPTTAPPSEGPADLKATFERRYAAWKLAAREPNELLRSSIPAEKEFREIIALGIPALPLIIDQIERGEEGDFFLGAAVLEITRKGFAREECPAGAYGDSHTAAKLYVKWWREGRGETPRLFAERYAAWRKYKELGRNEVMAEEERVLLFLGLDALPLMMEKIAAGDDDLLAIVNKLTKKALGDAPTRKSALAWWAANKPYWTLPPSEPRASVPQSATASAPSTLPAGAPAAGAATDTSATSEIALSVTADAESYVQGEPIVLRLVAQSEPGKSVACPYGSNRDFATAQVTVEFRRDGRTLVQRTHTRSHAKRLGLAVPGGFERRCEVVFMPGTLEGESQFVPLAPGAYEIVVSLNWDARTLVAPPFTAHITAAPEADIPALRTLDEQLVHYVEQSYYPWPSCPESATGLVERAGQSKLAAAIVVRRAADLWRHALEGEANRSADDQQKMYADVARELTTCLEHPQVASFAGEVLYMMAKLHCAQQELCARGKSLSSVRMDDATRTAWSRAGTAAAKTLARLLKEHPESSFNEDGRKLLADKLQEFRRALEKRPDSPNAAEWRAGVSELEPLAKEYPPR